MVTGGGVAISSTVRLTDSIGRRTCWERTRGRVTYARSPIGTPSTPPRMRHGNTLHQGDNNCIMPLHAVIPNQRKRFGFTVGGPATKLKVSVARLISSLITKAFARWRANFRKGLSNLGNAGGVIQVPDAAGVWQPYKLEIRFRSTVTMATEFVFLARCVRLRWRLALERRGFLRSARERPRNARLTR